MKMVSETVQNATGQVFIKCTVASDMKVSLADFKGNVVTRTIPINEYNSIMGQAARTVEEKWVHIPKGFIPGSEESGYIDGWVSDDGWAAIWKVKGQVRTLVHTSGHYQIPFPDLVFFVKKGKNNYTSGSCFVVDKAGTLYQYPFGNVSSSGSICMGNISTSDVVSILDYSDEFFLGVTNNDYYGTDHVKVSFSQQELLRKLDGKKEFPKRWLIKRGALKEEIENFSPQTIKKYY